MGMLIVMPGFNRFSSDVSKVQSPDVLIKRRSTHWATRLNVQQSHSRSPVPDRMYVVVLRCCGLMKWPQSWFGFILIVTCGWLKTMMFIFCREDFWTCISCSAINFKPFGFEPLPYLHPDFFFPPVAFMMPSILPRTNVCLKIAQFFFLWSDFVGKLSID